MLPWFRQWELEALEAINIMRTKSFNLALVLLTAGPTLPPPKEEKEEKEVKVLPRFHNGRRLTSNSP